MTHQHAARALGSSVDPYDQEEIDSGSDDEESATGIGMEVEAASAIQSQVCVSMHIYTNLVPMQKMGETGS